MTKGQVEDDPDDAPHIRARLGREDVRKMLEACDSHPEHFVCIDIDGALHDPRRSPSGYYITSEPEGRLHRIHANYPPDEIAEIGFDEVHRLRRLYDPSNFWSPKPNTPACCATACSTLSMNRTFWRRFARDRTRSSVGGGKTEHAVEPTFDRRLLEGRTGPMTDQKPKLNLMSAEILFHDPADVNPATADFTAPASVSRFART